MSRGNLHIRELKLRAEGLSPEQARALGTAVATRIAELRFAERRTIPSMSLRVTSSSGRSIGAIADQIVSKIRGRIG